MPRTSWLLVILAALTSATARAQTQEGASSGTVLEVVTVTAEKREESLQKTALAVSVLGGQELAQTGISQPEDLNRLVPGLNIGQSGASAQVYLRGVGNFSLNAFADPAVAFNFDGV